MYTGIIVTDWDELKDCLFSEKMWVNQKQIDFSKDYEKGDFLRVWCHHDECWCSAECGLDGCVIYQDHFDEDLASFFNDCTNDDF